VAEQSGCTTEPVCIIGVAACDIRIGNLNRLVSSSRFLDFDF
jgi:hypothetical protein